MKSNLYISNGKWYIIINKTIYIGKRRNKMRRYLCFIISGVLIVCIFFSGCSKKDEKKQADKNTLKVAVVYSEKEQGAVYKEIAREFEKKNENIKVEITNDFSDEEKVREVVSEKGDFDIIGIKRNQVIEYAKSGLITDITDFVEEKELNKKLYKICLAYGKYNGKNYGIGDMPMTIEWFYNVDMFDKYGIKEPRSIKELLDVSYKLKSKKITPVSIGALDGWTLTMLFGMITSQTTGTAEMTSGYGSDEKAFDKVPGIRNAFNIFGRIVDISIPQSSSEINYKKSIEDFITGKAAILPTGSWAVETIDQLKPSGFSYQVFESSVNMVEQPLSRYSATSGQVLVIPSKSKNAKLAKEFMEFLFSDDAQKIFASKGYIAPLKSANAGEETIKRRIMSHLESTDDNSIMILDNMEPKMAETTTSILQDILEDRVKPGEAWNRILKITFQK